MDIVSRGGIVAIGIALSGCAGIVGGTTETVAVTTTPVDGARCTLANSEGMWFVATPGQVTVHRTRNDLTVSCVKDGFQPASLIVKSHFNGATLGNVITGGAIGMGVDAATGANFDYQPVISVTLMPNAQTPSVPAPSAPAH